MRIAYCSFIQEMIKDGEPVIYQDETQFCSWHRPRKVWSYSDQPIPEVVSTIRYARSVIGGISNVFQGVCYIAVARNNAESFLDFLKKLVEKVGPNCAEIRPILVMDNYCTHFARSVRSYLHAHFRAVYLPPYSSELNNIEHLWSVSKNLVRRAIVENPVTCDADFFDIINTCHDSIPDETVRRIVEGNTRVVDSYATRIEELGGYEGEEESD